MLKLFGSVFGPSDECGDIKVDKKKLIYFLRNENHFFVILNTKIDLVVQNCFSVFSCDNLYQELIILYSNLFKAYLKHPWF